MYSLTGILAVTAMSADVKVINHLLLHMREWEFGTEETWDGYKILRTFDDLDDEDPEPTSPPVQEFSNNEFEGMTIQEVEALMLRKGKTLFLVLDDEGVRNKNLILVEQAHNYDSESIDDLFLPGEFDKMRIPWEDANIVHVNLSIGHGGFDESTSEMQDPRFGAPPVTNETIRARDHWWTFHAYDRSLPTHLAAKKAAAIQDLQTLGLA